MLCVVIFKPFVNSDSPIRRIISVKCTNTMYRHNEMIANDGAVLATALEQTVAEREKTSSAKKGSEKTGFCCRVLANY